MKALSIVLVLLTLLVPERDVPPTAEAELARFQGTWQVVALQDRGEKAAEAVARAIEVVIHKETITLRTGTEVSGAFQARLDPSYNPRRVDLTAIRGDDVGKVYPGIYTFEASQLTVVVNEPNRPRPTGFGAKDTTGLTVLVLRKKAP